MTREVLYESQCMDHPKVNPLFAGRPTRFAYFNASFPVEDQDKGAPPQARPNPTAGVVCLHFTRCWASYASSPPQLTPVRTSVHCGACCVPLLMPAVLCGVCARSRDWCSSCGSGWTWQCAMCSCMPWACATLLSAIAGLVWPPFALADYSAHMCPILAVSCAGVDAARHGDGRGAAVEPRRALLHRGAHLRSGRAWR